MHYKFEKILRILLKKNSMVMVYGVKGHPYRKTLRGRTELKIFKYKNIKFEFSMFEF